MLDHSSRIRFFIVITCVFAALSLLFSLTQSPPTFEESWWLAFGTLLLLSLVSEFLALRVTEGGSETSLDFVPQLGAVILLGPGSAGLLTLISWSFYQFYLTGKPLRRAIFNVAQMVLVVSISGLIYELLGGQVSLTDFSATDILPAFVGAVLVYFSVNSTLVYYIISLSEHRDLSSVWQQMSIIPLLFDIVMSSLALLLAAVYVAWGPVAIIAGIVPIIGLRYSYGVNLELRQLNTDLLRVLINTIEAQDPYTSGHSIRVAEGALAIAKALNLPSRRLRRIETAALLHDIGKIDSAFRDILQKSDSLSDEDWRLVRRHPERGVELVQDIRSMDEEVLHYIRHHHERYDGTGYPDGLQGEDIPLGSRIIMVSDSIDAMVTARPYRDALDLKTVRQELRKHAGEQFDRRIVEVALDIDLCARLKEAASNPEATRALRDGSSLL